MSHRDVVLVGPESVRIRLAPSVANVVKAEEVATTFTVRAGDVDVAGDVNGWRRPTEEDKNLSSLNLATNKVVQTRLLVKREKGWEALPYVWNDEQTEAFLRIAGASRHVDLTKGEQNTEFIYFVPNQNQCSACHVTRHPDGEMHPMGAITSH